MKVYGEFYRNILTELTGISINGTVYKATAIVETYKERDDLRAENEKLREALEKIDKGETTAYDEDVGTDVAVWMDEEEMQIIAREALNPSEPRT